MPFPSGFKQDIQAVGSGERYGSNNIILNSAEFENGLKLGRFAKLEGSSIDNLDASATPVVAGVPLREVSRSIEAGDALDTDFVKQMQFIRLGLVTVDVVPGQTPAAFAPVYAHNAAGDDIGKASTIDDASTEPTGAEFIREVGTDVWLVLLR